MIIIPSPNAIEIQPKISKRSLGGRIGFMPGQSKIVAASPNAWIELQDDSWSIIDIEDFDKIKEKKWTKQKVGKIEYVINRVPKFVYIHRLILNFDKIDHINCNGLDNRKINLRECTQSQNMSNCKKRIDNTSGYKGVSFHQKNKKWVAEIQSNKKRYYLGLFDSREDAHAAYVEAAKKYHKEFWNEG